MRIARVIASGLGCGHAPVAAGTVASAVAVAVGAGLLAVSPLALVAAALAATLGGWWAVERAAVEGDPGWVVVDEFAGQWITMLGLVVGAPGSVGAAGRMGFSVGPVSLVGLAAAFVAFRLLDITKLGPVGWADRRHGAFGIMADDVIAGLIGAAVLLALRFSPLHWPM